MIENLSPLKKTTNRISKVHFIYIVLFVLFASFLLKINFSTPLVGEDIILVPWNHESPPSGLINKTNALFNRIVDQSLHWNMRLGETLTIVTGAFDKSIFNILNTVIVLTLVLLLFVYAFGRFPRCKKPEDSVGLFLIIFFLICLNPVLGTIFFWKAGTANHTWGITLLLLFAVPYRLSASGKHNLDYGIGKSLLYCIAGFFAGITVESASFVIAVLIGLLTAWKIFARKKISLSYIFGAISFFSGVLLLINAPSTKIRRNFYDTMNVDGGASGLIVYINRLKMIIGDYIQFTWPVLLTFFIVLIILLVLVQDKLRVAVSEKRIIDEDLRNIFMSLIILGSSLASVVALVTIPYFSEEKRGFAFHWFILYAVTAYFCNEVWRRIHFNVKYVAICIPMMVLIYNGVTINSAYTEFYKEITEREIAIKAQKLRNEATIDLEPLQTKSSRILETREGWFQQNANTHLASFYHVNALAIHNSPIEISYSTESQGVIFNIDYINQDKSYIDVSGWGVIEGVESKQTEKYLLLRSLESNQDFLFTTLVAERSDVVKAYSNSLYLSSGFTSRISVISLPPGAFRLGIVLRAKDKTWSMISEKIIYLETTESQQ